MKRCRWSTCVGLVATEIGNPEKQKSLHSSFFELEFQLHLLPALLPFRFLFLLINIPYPPPPPTTPSPHPPPTFIHSPSIMHTTPPTISEHLLRAAAEHALRAFLEPNAIFLAQLLHTSYPSHASANLLATAHLRNGNYSQAAQALIPAKTPENRYLYAVCLTRIDTPDALRDAETCLRGVHGPIDSDLTPSSTSTPGGAAGLYLLANICQRTARKDEAVNLYRRALSANPTLWLAFEALANMGVVSKPENVLPIQSDTAALDSLHAQPQFFPHIAEPPTPRAARIPSREPQVSSTHRHMSNSLKANLNPRTPHHPDSYATPSPMPPRQPHPFAEVRTPAAPHPGLRNLSRRMSRRSQSPMTGLNGLRPGRRARSMAIDDNTTVRGDLFASSPAERVLPPPRLGLSRQSQHSANYVDIKSADHSTHASAIPTAEKPKQSDPDHHHADPSDSSQAIDLIRSLGQLVSELGRFRCTRVIELANALPKVHRNSAIVFALRGRAFLEKADYVAAEHEFERALLVDPARIDGVVEYYSTVLWHLKKEKELAQLALSAQRVFPVSYSAWCAAGNCFSLQNDPDAALKFFRRAIARSSAPNAYAYTLCGHEYVAKEDFESALASYREALNIDERHYNALYGIGQVLQKQEKFGLAHNHFRHAVQINPLNSTLHYHLGVSLAAGATAALASEMPHHGNRQVLISALAELETAANLDHRNPVPRFERAKILAAMNKLVDARHQLEELRDMLPKEAEVHFELSRVCLRMGDRKTAAHSLSIALDIEPKERKYKKALDSLTTDMETELRV